MQFRPYTVQCCVCACFSFPPGHRWLCLHPVRSYTTAPDATVGTANLKKRSNPFCVCTAVQAASKVCHPAARGAPVKLISRTVWAVQAWRLARAHHSPQLYHPRAPFQSGQRGSAQRYPLVFCGMQRAASPLGALQLCAALMCLCASQTRADVLVTNASALVAQVAEFGGVGQDLSIVVGSNVTVGDTSFDPITSLAPSPTGQQPFSQGHLTITAAQPRTILDASMRSNLLPQLTGQALFYLGRQSDPDSGFIMISLCEKVRPWPVKTE